MPVPYRPAGGGRGQFRLSTEPGATVTFRTDAMMQLRCETDLHPRPGPLARAGIACLLLLASCASSDSVNGQAGSESGGGSAPTAGISRFTYEIVNTYPHDPEAFTQGLFYDGGFLYESTGLHGRSSLRKVELTTGKVLRRRDLDQEFFGEGVALAGNRIFQLTYRERVGFRYDRDSFELLSTFRYETEGWGLTHDGERFIASDGTPVLRFRDSETFAETGRIEVTGDGRRVGDLNELEFVGGEIFANVWRTDLVARIDPATGEVTGWIDLEGLLPAAEKAAADVLNGIAWDEANGRLFVTGKLWPWLFEIRMKEIAD